MSTLRYISFDIRRALKEPTALAVSIALPSVLFIVFGASQTGTDRAFNDGNVAAYVMIGIALYGAISCTVSISGLTVVENVAGWGRQLGLTPMNTGKYLLSKCCVAFIMAAVPITAVNIVARMTKIDMPLKQQIACAALSILCAMVFGFFGLAIGFLVPSESAVGIANGILVVFSFFGTLFAPLTKDLMPYARFTPLYGAAEIARYPFSKGLTIISGSGAEWNMTEPLWYGIVNFSVWTVIFVVATALLMGRRTKR